MNNNPTILLIDDDIYVLNAARCMFTLNRYNVLSATSLSQARSVLENANPDIILMETNLPDGDGFDFFKEIENATSASIVFLTAKTESRYEVLGLKMGADGYLKKPFNKEVVGVRMDAVMQWHRKNKGGSRFNNRTQPSATM